MSHVLLPSCSTSGIPSVEVKIIQHEDSNFGDFLSSNEEPVTHSITEQPYDGNYSISSENATGTILWTCSYCGITRRTRRDAAEEHAMSCARRTTTDHTLCAYGTTPRSPARDTNFAVKIESDNIDSHLSVEPDQGGDAAVVSSEIKENELDYANEVLIISECGDCPFQEEEEEGTEPLRECSWCCPVCSKGIKEPVNEHLMLHSKRELVDVISSFMRAEQLDGSVSFGERKPTFQQRCTKYNADKFTRSRIDFPQNYKRATQQYKLDLDQAYSTNNILNDDFNNYNSVNKYAHDEPSTFHAELKINESNEACSTGSVEAPRFDESQPSVRRRSSHHKTRRRGVWLSRTPHKCPVCGKMLSSKGSLSKHIVIHSAHKPWNCSTCSIGFNSQRDLDNHVLQNHSNERSHVCSVCNKAFAIAYNLKEHMLFHGAKDKACDVCGKLFWTKKCVMRHKKRHCINKKYSCNLCLKPFAIKCELTSHKKKAHQHS